MNSADIRRSFVEFFGARGHRVFPSAPLVPHGDPTLLFTNAGMVPFKNYFLGSETPPAARAVSVQKCMRVSGKHNDLENVGPSPRHHTFFEMLGNFSFGDYFKEEAIRAAWQLVTEVWEIPADHLSATVFEEDDEAYQLWLELSRLPRERVHRCGRSDNFWAMGDTGPCGPSSEIFVDLHPGRPAVGWQEGTDAGRYLEIWNLVFMQFDRDEAGQLRPLPNPSIDTGAGLERVAAVLQRVDSNYDTDLFRPILRAAAELAGTRYGASAAAAAPAPDRDPAPASAPSPSTSDIALRVIADHLRAVAFLLADGVIPGNEGRGYVLRRVLRRAVRHGMRLGFEEPFLHRLVPVLGEVMGGAYLELAATREATIATIRAEEEKFLSTVGKGARQVQDEIERLRQAGGAVLPGAMVFRLYDTFGLPIDIIREIAEEERFSIDEEGFASALEAQREQSRKATQEVQSRLAALREVVRGHADLAETRFEGYDRTVLLAPGAEVVRLATFRDGAPLRVAALGAGQSGVAVLDQTVFYAEAGGQVGDTGLLLWEGGGRARVADTQKDSAGVVYHFIEVERGELAHHTKVELRVDHELRLATQRNHTATHLLHAALRQVLEKSVRQAGSLVAPDRLRFDFTYHRGLLQQEQEQVEELVNEWVRRSVATEVVVRSYQEAIAAGAMALFGEKYGERVRTVGVPGFSLELCGGCHVRSTGEIGLFLIGSERGIASGVRRIEALTGAYAFAEVRRQRATYAELLSRLGIRAADQAQQLQKAEQIRQRQGELEQEVRRLRLQLVAGGGGAAGTIPGAGAVGGSGDESLVDGVRVLAREVPAAPAEQLRDIADALRAKLGSGVVVIGSRGEDTVSLVAAVSKDLTSRVKAGELVKKLSAMVGGGGGGRPDFAQAGGREPEKLPGALAAVREMVREQLRQAPSALAPR
ncbi:MAG TPA: alanine--tRNA ligase [Thermoanaerobaculia bacterium]|nr:alanine--tRNA ligase [Thermoanaerobaculia bacterium]